MIYTWRLFNYSCSYKPLTTWDDPPVVTEKNTVVRTSIGRCPVKAQCLEPSLPIEVDPTLGKGGSNE